MGSSASVEPKSGLNSFIDGQTPFFKESIYYSILDTRFEPQNANNNLDRSISDTTIYDVFTSYKRLTTERTQDDVVRNVLIPLICESYPKRKDFDYFSKFFDFISKRSNCFLETYERTEKIIMPNTSNDLINTTLVWKRVYNLRGVAPEAEQSLFCNFMNQIRYIKLNFSTIDENKQASQYVHKIITSNSPMTLINSAIKWGLLNGDISLLLKICSFGVPLSLLNSEKIFYPKPTYIIDFIKEEKENGRFVVESCTRLKGHSSIVATPVSIFLLSAEKIIKVTTSESCIIDMKDSRFNSLNCHSSSYFITSSEDTIVVGTSINKIAFVSVETLISNSCDYKANKMVIAPLCSDGHFIYSMANPSLINVFEINKNSICFVREIFTPKLFGKEETNKIVMITNGIVIQIITLFIQEGDKYIHAVRTISAWNGTIISDTRLKLNYIISAAAYEPITRTVWVASKYTDGCGIVRYKYDGPDSPAVTGFSIQEENISMLTEVLDRRSNNIQFKIPAGFDNLIAPILGANPKVNGFNKSVLAMFQRGYNEDIIQALYFSFRLYQKDPRNYEYSGMIWTCLASISLFARSGSLALNWSSTKKLISLLKKISTDRQFRQVVLYSCVQILNSLEFHFKKQTMSFFTFLFENSTHFQLQYLIGSIFNSRYLPALLKPTCIPTFAERIVQGDESAFIFVEGLFKILFREMLNSDVRSEIVNAALDLSEALINSVIKNIRELDNKKNMITTLLDEFLQYLRVSYNNFFFIKGILPKLLSFLKTINMVLKRSNRIYYDDGGLRNTVYCAIDIAVAIVIAITSITGEKVLISDVSYLISKSAEIVTVKPSVKIEDVYRVSNNITNRKMSATDKNIELKIFTALSHHLSTPIRQSAPIVKVLYKIRSNLRTSRQKTAEYNESSKERSPELIEEYDKYLGILMQKVDFLLTRSPFFSTCNEENLDLISQFLINQIPLESYKNEVKNIEGMNLAISEAINVICEFTKINFFSNSINDLIFDVFSFDGKITSILSEYIKSNIESKFLDIKRICDNMFAYITEKPSIQEISFTSLLIMFAMEKFGPESWILMESLFKTIVLANNNHLHSFNSVLTLGCCIQKLFINHLGNPPLEMIKEEINLIELLPPESNFSMTIAASLMMAGIPNDINLEISVLIAFVEAEDFHSFGNFLFEFMHNNETNDLSGIYILLFTLIGSAICGNKTMVLYNYVYQNNVSSKQYEKVNTPDVTIKTVIEMAQILRRILPESNQLQAFISGILRNPKNRRRKGSILLLTAALFVISNSIIVPLKFGIVRDNNQPYLILDIDEKNSRYNVISLPITSSSYSTHILFNPGMKYDTLIRFNPSDFQISNPLMSIFEQSLIPSKTFYDSIINFFAMASLREYVADVDTGEEFARSIASAMSSKLTSFQFRQFSDTAIMLIKKSINSNKNGFFEIPNKIAKMEHASFTVFNDEKDYVPSDTSFNVYSGYHVYMSSVLDSENRTYFSITKNKMDDVIIGITTLSLDDAQTNSLEFHTKQNMFIYNGSTIPNSLMDFNIIELMFDPIKKKACAAIDRVRKRVLRVNFTDSFACFFAIVPPFSNTPFTLSMKPITDCFQKKIYPGLIVHPSKIFRRMGHENREVIDGSQEFRLLKDCEGHDSNEKLLNIVDVKTQEGKIQQLKIKEFNPFSTSTEIKIGFDVLYKSRLRPTIWSSMRKLNFCVESDAYGNLSYLDWDDAQMEKYDSLPNLHFKKLFSKKN